MRINEPFTGYATIGSCLGRLEFANFIADYVIRRDHFSVLEKNL